MHCTGRMTTDAAVELMVCGNDSEIKKQRINGIFCNCAILCHVESEKSRLDWRRDGMGVWLETKHKARIPYSVSTMKMS